MGNKGFIKGLIAGLMIPILLLIVLTVANVANIGNLVQSIFLVNNTSYNAVSWSKQIEGAAAGMVDSIGDQYSYYLTSEEQSALSDEIEGSYTGVGIYLGSAAKGEPIYIMAPIKDTPAFKAGLKSGDLIIAVDGKDVTGMDTSSVSQLVRGEPGTKVKLKVVREGSEDPLFFEMNRADINIPTVDGKFIDQDKGIAYVSVSMFHNRTYNEFVDKLNELDKIHSVDKLIIDLRNNPGGSVPTVISMAEVFVKNDKPIFWYETNKSKEAVKSSAKQVKDIPIVVLVNENSASGSEILAGALKDYKLADIVGVTTYGKGIIQTVYSLKDGAGLKLTTSKYYTPNMVDIHKKGIVPNYVVDMKAESELIYSVDPQKDVQLKKAIEIINNK